MVVPVEVDSGVAQGRYSALWGSRQSASVLYFNQNVFEVALLLRIVLETVQSNTWKYSANSSYSTLAVFFKTVNYLKLKNEICISMLCVRTQSRREAQLCNSPRKPQVRAGNAQKNVKGSTHFTTMQRFEAQHLNISNTENIM